MAMRTIYYVRHDLSSKQLGLLHLKAEKQLLIMHASTPTYGFAITTSASVYVSNTFLFIILDTCTTCSCYLYHYALSPILIRRLMLVHVLTSAIGIPVNGHITCFRGLILLALSFAFDLDVQYIEVYKNEQLFAKVTDAIVDECMLYYHYVKSAWLGHHPLFFYVTCEHYIGVFSREHDIKPMVQEIHHAIYAEVKSLKDREKAVRSSVAAVPVHAQL
ncbi:uncharacterized protein HD556DRAFT_1310314 [Suillus plorans]|uniref:Uncharacterized protein n=1 Tax=Suillus plorans TaxID=116603 RepID=A0A9P7ALD4_9AGAM|nr:uncharacterized protein HD556DRAFT_1310314 [Suillus plorans]KAG1790765.1 hypothetical protein HD556DRAFT_1310314 [Suillus plorans]